MAKPKKFIVGGLLNLGAGIGTAAISYAQRQKALRQLAQVDQAESSNIMSMAARNRVARQETDATAATEAAGRATASQLAAAQEAGGSRAVQSTGPSAQRAQEEAVARSLARFGQYGAAISEQDDAGVLEASRARSAPRIQSLQLAADAATQNMVGGVAQAASGLAQTIGGIGKKPQKTPSAKDTEGIKAAAPAINKMGDFAAQQSAGISQKINENLGSTLARPRVTPETTLEIEQDRMEQRTPRILKTGGKALKTPGDFSHKTNPIDVIKGGKKIAEMTGGEYIFNPKQSQKLRNLAEDGTSTLHKFVRELLSKSQFK
jgi:hypothetical protein